MVYKEEIKDLFLVSSEYYLAHCISADFGMGKGIVVEFNRRFDMKRKIQTMCPNYVHKWNSRGIKGDCILVDRVLNLITKERYFNKPTYLSLTYSLKIMKNICEEEDIKKIAMPIIGCGLDRLEWTKVSAIIKEIFKDTEIEILVCK